MEPAGVEVDRIEGEAERILTRVPAYVWDGESLPVPVDDIVADVFGLLVRLVEDLSTAPGCEDIPPDQLSGLLLTGPGEIWVNSREAEQWDGRRRFTIGHELGHYVMHQSRETKIFCRSIKEGAGGVQDLTNGSAPDSEFDPEPRIAGGARSVPELEANAFAAALMMPRHLIVAQYGESGGNFDSMRQAFHASEKAMRYRIEAMETWS